MDPFLGEIRPVGFNFAPRGWALCQGQILPISQNTALFSLLGTNYGGNGTVNFALPNLQGNVAIGARQGPGLSSFFEGQTGGQTSVTLTTAQLPAHSHSVRGSSAAATSRSPSGNFPAKSVRKVYTTPAAGQLIADAVISTGSGFPHNNMQPYLSINYIIALQGIFPSRP